MDAVLVIEEDTLVRELMREHLERDGYAACAVATVRAALDAVRWTTFALVLLDAASAARCPAPQLDALREVGAPVVLMRAAAAGSVVVGGHDVEQVVWSPFDLATLTAAVQGFLAPPAPRRSRPPSEAPAQKGATSGTYVATRPDDAGAGAERPSLVALGALVLEATRARSAG